MKQKGALKYEEQLFTTKVDKSDCDSILAYFREQMKIHFAKLNTKKSNDEKVMEALKKFEDRENKDYELLTIQNLRA